MFLLFNCCTNNKPIKQTTVAASPIYKAPLIVVAGDPTINMINATNLKRKIIAETDSAFVSKSSPTHQLKNNAFFPPTITTADYFPNMTIYNTEQGLPASTILCSYCDKAGKMWWGTDGGGVCCYDGKTFTTFNTSNGLPNNHIWCIMEDNAGNFWFGTDGNGVCFYNGKSFKTFTVTDGLPSNKVNCILQDKYLNIWFGTNNGLCSFNGKKFINYQLINGVTNLPVICSFADKNDNLWFGTSSFGIFCFSKNTFTNFTTNQGLPSNYISSINDDSKGNIWIGSVYSMVSKYNNYTSQSNLKLAKIPKQKVLNANSSDDRINYFSNFSLLQTDSNNSVSKIQEDADGNLWFATDLKGLFCLNGKTLTELTIAQGLPNIRIKCLTKDKSGYLWIGTYGGGVCRYDGKALSFFTQAQGLPSNTISCINEDRTGTVWIGSDEGLTAYNGNKIDANQASINLSSTGLNNLFSKNKKTFTTFKSAQGLSSNTIRTVYEDRTGNIWIGSIYTGVNRYDGNRVDAIRQGITSPKNNNDLIKINGKYVKTFSNLIVVNEIGQNSVRCITEDRKGNLWFGTQSRGICKYDGNRIDAINNGAMPNKYDSLHLKKINGTYVKTISAYGMQQGLPDKTIYCIMEDSKGNIWMGTQNGGAIKYDGNRVDEINSGGMLSNNDSHDLKMLNGKYEKTFTAYTTEQGLGNNCIFKIAEDSAGNLWFATYGGGLSRFDGKSFINFNAAYGLGENETYDIVFDNKGNLITGTDHGFAVLKGFQSINKNLKNQSILVINATNHLTNIELKTSYEPVFEHYNKKTGYPVKDIVNCAMFYDSRGVIWAGCGDDKLVCFDYNAVTRDTQQLNVFVQNIKVNEENICWSCLDENPKTLTTNEELLTFGKILTTQEKETMKNNFSGLHFESITPYYPIPVNLELPFKNNSITFDFTAIAPAKSAQVRYQFMLTGYNKSWNPVTEKTTATFGNMHEGNYTFKLAAQNPFGVWSKTITYSFKVLPPWYRSWWAYSLYVLSALLSVWSFIKWREIKLKEKADFEKRISEVEMQALRSQMNPHFIFNSLHSVNKYMLDNDKQNASEYLSKFSKLMRLILENSRHQEVPLENDLAALDLYLQLETLRFKNRFQYKIEVADEIDRETVLIPPLLLQPFVENSIIHGVSNKENGLIQIKISKFNSMMRCIVEDNGVGRKEKVKDHSGNELKRESLGMKITQERLHIIEQLKKVKTTINIYDLKDEQNNSIGLRIELLLPLENAF